MRRLVLLLALAALAVGALPGAVAGAASLPPVTKQRLDRALAAAFAKTRAPGVIVGVWVGDKGWTATKGTTVRGGRDRPTIGDHTRIGSVTKTFTGTVILQLVEEGKLRLDESIEKWFPTAPEAAHITIRELGDMSSGINTYTADEAITNKYFADPEAAWKPSALIAGGLALPLKFAPGTGFFYSDTNTLMLARIAEAVTGKTIGALLRERIFAPLKLKGTSFPSTARLPKPFWNGYTDQSATGPGPMRDSTDWSPTFAWAAGAIVSTLPDLHRWAVAMGTGSLLSPAEQAQRLKPNPHSAADGRAYLFCLGRDHGWLTHTGDIPGYNSTVAYLPKAKATVVVLADTDAEADDATGEPALPAPAIFSALAQVVTPGNVPTGTH
jgi:D-alanyl-D-alanine carboxypeptidase